LSRGRVVEYERVQRRLQPYGITEEVEKIGIQKGGCAGRRNITTESLDSTLDVGFLRGFGGMRAGVVPGKLLMFP